MDAPGGRENGPGPTHQDPRKRRQPCLQTQDLLLVGSAAPWPLVAEQERVARCRAWGWRRSHRLPGSGRVRTMCACLGTCMCTGVCGDSGTLEPCLAKTSHSPLVSAISSLMGHLNSSGRIGKEVKGAQGSCDTDSKHKMDLLQNPGSWETGRWTGWAPGMGRRPEICIFIRSIRFWGLPWRPSG